MPELGTSGSVRGARGNSRPYRDPSDLVRLWKDAVVQETIVCSTAALAATPMIQGATMLSMEGIGSQD